MDGPILAEFSSLNALGTKSAAVTYGAGQRGGSVSARGPRSARGSERADADQRERLLRGEANYTGGSVEHFIEDQPQGSHLGVAHLLPQTSTTEERERLLRRLEMCAKAREESTRVMSIRFARRDQAAKEYKRDRVRHTERMVEAQQDREERWSRRLQRSPFAVDLVAENQRIDEENRVRDHMEQRKSRIIAKRNREAHNAIFRRATEEVDELDQLRKEKRALLENERRLKALKDVERSNARTAQILQDRRRQQMERLQQMDDGISETASPQSPPQPYSDPVSARG